MCLVYICSIVSSGTYIRCEVVNYMGKFPGDVCLADFPFSTFLNSREKQCGF